MTARFAQQTALITGGASGIGRATANLLAAEGARVLVADIDPAGIESAVAAIEAAGGTAEGLHLDVTSEDDWDAAIAQAETAAGGLAVLVNCAGVAYVSPLAVTPLREWRRVLAVNLDGVFLGTRSAVRAMQRRGRGSIVNVASASGLKATPAASAYCASKAAVLMFTKSAAIECAQNGTHIRINAVAPGAVKTPLWERTPGASSFVDSEEWKAAPDAPHGKRFADPLEIARAIAYLASSDASYVTGSILTVDAGYSAS